MGTAKAQSLPGSCQEEGASVSPAGQPLLAPSGSFPYPIALPECPWILDPRRRGWQALPQEQAAEWAQRAGNTGNRCACGPDRRVMTDPLCRPQMSARRKERRPSGNTCSRPGGQARGAGRAAPSEGRGAVR